MEKPTPPSETPVERRSRQIREGKDSETIRKSKKSMDELVVVNKKIAKTLANKGKRDATEESKTAKLVRGMTITAKVLGDTNGAIKAWRGMSKKSEQKFNEEYKRLNKLHASLAESLSNETDGKEVARIERELEANRQAIKKMVEDRQKTKDFFGGETITASIKKSVKSTVDGFKDAVSETLHIGGDAKGRPMKVEIPPTITKKLLDQVANTTAKATKDSGNATKKQTEELVKNQEKVAEKSDKKADKRQSEQTAKLTKAQKKTSDEAETKATKRQAKAEKKAEVADAKKTAKADAKEKAKERKESDKATRENAKATNQKRKQQEAQLKSDQSIDEESAKRDDAREKRDAKRQVAKTDIEKLADKLEASFASRLGGQEDSIVDDLLDMKRKGKKGGKGKGKPKTKPNGKKSPKTPKAPKAPKTPKTPKTPKAPKAPKVKPPKPTGKIANVASKAGNVLSKAGSGVASIGGQLTGSVGAASGAVTAGAVVASAVAGLAIGTKMVESGLLDRIDSAIFGKKGIPLSQQYSLGDVISNTFGDGTRNIERGIQAEKEKALARADKLFKDFKPVGGGPWQGVSDARLKELQAPNQMMITNRYYSLWMRESEWSATSNIMNNHRDADKLPQAKRDEANAIWKQAMTARIQFKKDYIVKVGYFGADQVNTKETQNAMTKADKKADSTVKGQAQAVNESSSASSGSASKANAVATAPPPKFTVASSGGAGGGAVGSAGVVAQPSVPASQNGSSGGSQPTATARQSQSQSNPSVGGSDIQGFESWLISAFVPALASAIARQIPNAGAQDPTQNRQANRQAQSGLPSRQAVMPTPAIYK